MFGAGVALGVHGRHHPFEAEGCIFRLPKTPSFFVVLDVNSLNALLVACEKNREG